MSIVSSNRATQLDGIAERIQEARTYARAKFVTMVNEMLNLGFTKSLIAKRSGMSVQTIIKILENEDHVPSREVLIAAEITYEFAKNKDNRVAFMSC